LKERTILEIIIKNIIKYLIASFLVFFVLNTLCYFYYKRPINIPTKTGVTDFYNEPHFHYSQMLEGYGFGVMNNEGFNNLFDYTGQNVDVLLMGSSQIEATNVPQNLTTNAFLNQYFNNEKCIYNIATSHHGFSQIINAIT
jgi:hypothetical protein